MEDILLLQKVCVTFDFNQSLLTKNRTRRPQYHSSTYTTPNVAAACRLCRTQSIPLSPRRSSPRNSYTGGSSSAYVTDGPSSQPFATPSRSGSRIPQAPKPVSSTDNLGPVPRAARTINEFLTTEARYPPIDDTASRRPPPLLLVWVYRLMMVGGMR